MAQKYDLSIVFKVINQATAPIKAFQKQLQDAMKPVSGMGQSFSRFAFQAREHLSSLGNYLTNFTGKVVSVGKSFASMGKESLLALGGVTAGIGASILGVTGYADDLGDLAANLGISTTQLQKWRFAAEMTGSSAGKLDQGLSVFVKNLGDARKGSGEAYEALKKLEIGLTDGQGNFKTTAQLIDEVSDRISGMSEQEGFKIISSFFGGTELFSMMKLGSTGIRQFGEDLKQINGIMSEEFIEASGSFQDSFNKLKKVILSFITSALTPTIKKLTEITDGLVLWSKENPKTAKTIVEFAKAVGIFAAVFAPIALAIGLVSVGIATLGGTTSIILAVISVLTALAVYISEEYPKAWAVIKNVSNWIMEHKMIILGALAGIQFAIVAFVAAVNAPALIPFIGWPAVIAGIAALAYVVIKNWEPISAWFKDLWKDILFELDWFLKTFKKAWMALPAWFSEIGDKIKNFFADIYYNGILPGWLKELLGLDKLKIKTSILTPPPPIITGEGGSRGGRNISPFLQGNETSFNSIPKERVEVSLRVSTDKDSQVLISNIDKTAGTNFNLISESYLGTLFPIG